MATFPACLDVAQERARRGRTISWALAASLLLAACSGERSTDPTSVQKDEFTRERALADGARAAWVKANPDKNPDDNPTARVFMARIPNVVGLQDSTVLLDDGRLMAWEDLLAHRLDPDRHAPARKDPYVTGRSRDYAVLADGTVKGGRFPGPLPTDISTIAQGGNFTLLLRKNGTVWGFGGNEYGQIGTSAHDPDHNPPREVAKSLDKVTAIAAGFRHAIALRQDGSVWQWGLRDLKELQRNRYGQVPGPRRDGHFAPVPAQLASLSGIVQIVAGTAHNAALGRDGRVWAWGDEALPVAQSASTPVLVPGLQHIVALAAGPRHTLALDRDGAVWGWGTLSEYSMFPDSELRAHVPGHPRKLGRLGPVSKIFTSFNLSAFVLRDQSLWYVGAGPWTM